MPGEFSAEQPGSAGCASAISIDASAHASRTTPALDPFMTIPPELQLYQAEDRAAYSATLSWTRVRERVGAKMRRRSAENYATNVTTLTPAAGPAAPPADGRRRRWRHR